MSDSEYQTFPTSVFESAPPYTLVTWESEKNFHRTRMPAVHLYCVTCHSARTFTAAGMEGKVDANGTLSGETIALWYKCAYCGVAKYAFLLWVSDDRKHLMKVGQYPSYDQLKRTGEMLFPSGSEHDAYKEIRAILQKVNRSIAIIDPYVDRTLFQLLATHSGSAVKVHILSSRLPPDFGLEAKKFLTQYPLFQMEIRTTKEFHDRFIIFDDSNCFHIGASIKDAGSKVFMISQVEDPTNCDALLNQHQRAWASATPLAV